MIRNLAFALALGLGISSAAAQEGEAHDSILVFDGSGSMWGQIDGVPKITIAREVVQGLLDDLPASRRLGLVAYGHNRKGDCRDIQTLVPVGTDRAAITSAIEGINPVGMTPMTAAVEQAAEALKFTENQATVILVSDGQETCHADPCQAAANLAKLGVGLTVHTVGFGLGAEEAGARGELSCIAEATGGRFFVAEDAAELRAALDEISATPAPAAPEAPAVPIVVDVEASVRPPETGAAGATVRVSWTGPDDRGDYVSVARTDAGDIRYETYTYTDRGNPLQLRLPAEAGEYEVRYVNAKTRKVLARQPITVTAVEASVDAPATGAAGDTIRLAWSGPDYQGDYISVAKPDADDNRYDTYTYTSRGNPLQLRLPADPGEYEVRYIQAQKHTALVREPITVTPVSATVEAPARAVAGSTVAVSWTGPDYGGDYISVAKPDANDNRYEAYTYTSRGNPLQLRMPKEPGTYEVRYIQAQKHQALVRQTITVTGD